MRILSEMFYADAALSAGSRLDIPADQEERVVYVAEGRITIIGVAAARAGGFGLVSGVDRAGRPNNAASAARAVVAA